MTLLRSWCYSHDIYQYTERKTCIDNFTFYSPTCFVFGKDAENQAGSLVRRFNGSKVLIHYGGGSVIDSSKAIAAGTIYDGDFWDFYSGKRIEDALPVGTILTIAAAGSEGSPDSVITKEEGMFKRGPAAMPSVRASPS